MPSARGKARRTIRSRYPPPRWRAASSSWPAIHAGQLELAARQRGGGYLDRIVRRALPRAEGIQDPARLLAASASQFCDSHRRGDLAHNLAGMTAQEPFVGTGQAVFRKEADDVEQRRANLVVEILRR